MKIIKVVYPLDAIESAGMEGNAIRLANSFIKEEKYDISFLSLTGRVGRGERRLDPRVKIFRLSHKKRFFVSFHKLKESYFFFRKLKPHIVHTRNWQGLDAFIAAYLAKVPILIHGEHGFDLADILTTNRKKKVFRQFVYYKADHLITVSQNLKKKIIKEYDISPDKISYIPNGVDLEKFNCSNSPPKDILVFRQKFDFILGIVARLDPIKNHIFLFDTFKKFSSQIEQKSCLLVVGDGFLEKELQNYVFKNSLENSIYFLGNRKDIPRVLRIFDVFILPSIMEGMPNTVLEAMASCVPVIASNVGGIPEIIDHGRTGFLFSPERKEELLSQLIKLCGDSLSLQKISVQARQEVEKKFSFFLMFKRYKEIYENLLNNKG